MCALVERAEIGEEVALDRIMRRHRVDVEKRPAGRTDELAQLDDLFLLDLLQSENDEDAFAQLLLRPIPGLPSRSDFHNIRVTEGTDLWYQGSGATVSDRDVGFGYSGRPANGHHELMEVVETSLSYE